MKLAYIIDVLDTDLAGTENQLIKMINGLSSRGFDINLICFREHLWLRENAPSLSCKTTVFEISKLKNPNTYVNIFRLISYLKSIRPDVVHTFFPTANIIGVIAAKLAGVQGVISSRRDYGEWMSKRYLVATKFANRFVDKVITNSNMVKELTINIEGMEGSKIDVIYNGISVEKFESLPLDESTKEGFGIQKNDKVVGLIANFRPMKHHATLIRAANEILKEREDVSFLLVGEGPMMEETKKLAESLGVANKIVFAGARNDVLKILPIINVGVNCSEGEGLSNAIMEYMCAGIPCVVSAGGGNPDLIENDVRGFLFDLDDYNALAQHVIRLLDDDVTCSRITNASKEFMKSNMELDVIISKYKNVYQSMIGA